MPKAEVPKAEAPLWPVESVICSTTDPKSKPKCGQDSHPEQIASVDSGETCLEDVKMAEKVDVQVTECQINKSKELAHEKEAPAMPRTMLFTGNVVNTQNEELVDREETKLEVIEAMIKGIAVKKIYPTQKASEMLTRALLEQQKMHALKKANLSPRRFDPHGENRIPKLPQKPMLSQRKGSLKRSRLIMKNLQRKRKLHKKFQVKAQ